MLYITHIQSEELIPVQNQDQLMYQFTKSDLNYSYSRSHFSRLPQSVAKNLVCCLSHKVSYASKIIDPVINVFSSNDLSSHLKFSDHWIVTFGSLEKCVVLLITSRVDSLYRLRRSVIDKVKTDTCILQKSYHSKESNIIIQYANNFVHKLGMVDPTTFFYQFIYDKKDKNDTQIT